jgi:hypothetical protein
MSWLFSRVLVEEYLEESSLDGEPSAQSSGSLTQQAYCAPDKMTAFSRPSRFGMTFAHLTADRGEELLTLYLAAFHARTYQPQDEEWASKESEAECGEKWRASFTKFDPDSCSWKTAQCSLLGGLDEFSQTWPQWGLMRDGECWEQRTLAQTTKETEFGFWPTPRVLEIDESYGGYINRMMRSGNPKNIGKTRPQNLTMAVKMWPTPTCHMAKETNAPSEHNRNTPTLTAQVNWPTPRTKGMCGGSGSWDLLNKNTTKEEARQMGAGNGGKLNPMWVEWLMGWPLGWTDLKPLAMDKFPCVQQQPGESCAPTSPRVSE